MRRRIVKAVRVAPKAQIKPGERVVVEAMQEQASPWRRLKEDPPEPGQLIAMAEYSKITRRWTYGATKLERDQIAFWKQVDSDVRWMPLQEVEV